MNEVAVVTGAAGGIGQVICARLLQRGMRVVICLLYTSPSPRDS